MASRVRSYMLSAWRWGKQHDRDYRYQSSGIRFNLIGNPVADVPRDKGAENVCDRVLTWCEIKKLWNAPVSAISIPMRVALQLCLITGGQRPGEVLGMCDSELNLDECIWRLPGSRAKNGRDHVVPLTDAAVGLIESAGLWRGESDFIFPKRRLPAESAREDSLYTAVVRYCKRSEVESWTPKDLRTTFKTLGGECGLSKEIRDRVQNHTFGDVGSRHYDMWSYLPEKREALKKWEQRLLAALM